MPRPIRVALRPTVLLAAIVGLLAMGAVPASAGGPTSVLISSPSAESTASLYATDPDYEVLFEALGGMDPEADPSAAQRVAGRAPGPGGSQVNVTWLIHDVSVWRVDRIVTDNEGDVWVYTESTAADPYGRNQDGTWHRSPKPEELRDLLDRLGVTWSGSTTTDSPPDDATAHDRVTGNDDAKDRAEPPDSRQAALGPDTTSPWAWVVPGVLAGALLGVAADRRLRRGNS